MKKTVSGNILGVSVYADGDLLAENVNVTLPSVDFEETTVQALGELSLPAPQRPGAMELTVNFIGTDFGFIQSISPQKKQYEIRWAQEEIDIDGNKNIKGHKAFCDCFAKSIPSPAISLGEAGENGVSFDVVRYELFIDNEQALLIDKTAGKVKINGVDYTENLESLL